MLNIKTIFTPRLLGAAIAAAALISPAIASAQEVPSYANGDANQQIQGTVSSINDTWNISVTDSNGYTDSVELHQGTIINPTGLTLEPGMSVTIAGYPDGSNFDAMEIDTPYQYEGPPPTPVYYGAGAWYPGYAYGWGPSFSLFFDFSSRNFERRSFSFAGEVRHAMAPPAGWENRPHGYIGNAGNARGAQRSYAPPASVSQYRRPTVNSGAPHTAYAAPQPRTYGPPQQTRSFVAPPQQTRSFVRTAAANAHLRRTAAADAHVRRSAAADAQLRSAAADAQLRSAAAADAQLRSAAADAQLRSAAADAHLLRTGPSSGSSRRARQPRRAADVATPRSSTGESTDARP